MSQPPQAVKVTVRQKRWGKRLVDAAWAAYGLGVVVMSATMLVCTTLALTPPMPIAGLILLGSMMLGAAAPPLWLAGLAAAIALGSDPAQRPRIRVAADTAVSPRMRVALEELADGAVEDAILEEALAEEADAASARAERSR